jgi:hypothetical protein
VKDLARLERGLREIAAEMKLVLGESADEEACYQLVHSTYLSLRRQYREDMDRMDEGAIMRVLRKQMGELVRLGRADRLLNKRHHIAPPSIVPPTRNGD